MHLNRTTKIKTKNNIKKIILIIKQEQIKLSITSQYVFNNTE